MKISNVETTPLVAVEGVAAHGARKQSAPHPKAPPAPVAAPSPAANADQAAAPEQARRVVTLPEFPHYDLSFHLDKEHGRVVVEVIDAKTGTVVRTVPPEEFRHLVAGLPNPRGILLDRES